MPESSITWAYRSLAAFTIVYQLFSQQQYTIILKRSRNRVKSKRGRTRNKKFNICSLFPHFYSRKQVWSKISYSWFTESDRDASTEGHIFIWSIFDSEEPNLSKESSTISHQCWRKDSGLYQEMCVQYFHNSSDG